MDTGRPRVPRLIRGWRAWVLALAVALLTVLPLSSARAATATVSSYEPDFFRSHVLAVGVLVEVRDRKAPWRARVLLQDDILARQPAPAVVDFEFPDEMFLPGQYPALRKGARVVACLRREGRALRYPANPRISLFPNGRTLCPVPTDAELERVRRTLRAFAGAFAETDPRRRAAVLLGRPADFGDAWSAGLLAGQLRFEGAVAIHRPAVLALARDALEDRARPFEHRLAMDEVLRESGITLLLAAPSRLEALRELRRAAPDADARARAAGVLRRSVEVLEHAVKTTESEEARRPYAAALEAYRAAAAEAGAKR
jgi:hypothetical protein